MNILVINSGSSSIKYKLMDMDRVLSLAEGLLERIGESIGTITHIAHPDTPNSQKIFLEEAVPDHGQGMETIVSLLTSPRTGVIETRSASLPSLFPLMIK